MTVEREKGETLASYRTRQLEEKVAILQSDVLKIKERLMWFFFILLASNLIPPEIANFLKFFGS